MHNKGWLSLRPLATGGGRTGQLERRRLQQLQLRWWAGVGDPERPEPALIASWAEPRRELPAPEEALERQ